MRSTVLCSALVIAALAAVTGAGPAIAAPLALTGPLPAQSAPPQGGVGLRLVDIPTAAREDPRAQLYLVDHLAPGEVIARRIEVSNTTTGPLHVVLYPAAASIADGSFSGAAGRTSNDLSSWTTLSQDAVDLAPGATATDTVTVTVPADAAPGEQYAAVWAEIGASNASGVNLVNRVGIRMYLSIGGGNAPASSFTVDPFTAQRAPDGHPVVLADVHNTGGRALDLSGTLSLTNGPGALSAGPFPAQAVSTLAPGDSGTVMIPLDRRLPDGPWDAELSVASGQLTHAFRAAIQFPSDPGVAAPAVTQPAGDRLPWLLIGGLALLVVLAAVVARLVVRRARDGARR